MDSEDSRHAGSRVAWYSCRVSAEGISRFKSAALRIASWTLASRVLGLIRDRLMFAEFGRGPVLGAFHLAWTVPNTFRRLLGEGALTAAFVPVLTRRLESDGLDAARASVAAVLGRLLLVLLGVALLLLAGIALLPAAWLEALPDAKTSAASGAGAGSGAAGSAANTGAATPAAGDGSYADLLRLLLFVLVPYLLPVCLTALAAAVQNVRGRFALPAAAPLLLNALWIAALLVAHGLELDAEGRAFFVAACVLFGGAAQLLLQVPGVISAGLFVRPRFVRHPDTAAVARNMLPMLLGLSVVQINVLMTQLLAAALVDRGAPSILFLSNRMLEFPHALLGVALGTAVFPLLATLGERKDQAGVRDTIDRSLGIGIFLAVPAAAGLCALAPWLIEVLFGSGRFTPENVAETADVLRVHAFAVPGLIVVQVLARAHYALHDMKTPVRIAAWLLLAAQVLNVLLAPRFATVGLAISSVFAATSNAIWLSLSLRRKKLPGGGRAMRALVQAAIAALPTAGIAWWSASYLAELFPADSGLLLRIATVLIVPGALGMAAFFATARLLRAQELDDVLEALRKRRERS